MSTPHKPLQFLITGCSSGLGLELARAVLASGHKVIASSRNPSKTPEFVAEIETAGGAWIELDVSKDDVGEKVEGAMKKYGEVDVLVNSAGYPQGGVLESIQ
jgi:NAD(P)-dependent dehydrogenase (short-subunit alcohol dehydrogenase family)